ncbi:hypothetical protein [Rheinheimera sp. UJ63]|uniref:hypothetical protein n=1 Tax=Rheinheimera sp. UJ63 TaxID=2910157 RepID=UPI001F3C699E|nr:hypothetical protein [Rheinheimera sp. UJ63]MCF4009967.1 hypothetical protein [Rheinheimera sp. UJ63]
MAQVKKASATAGAASSSSNKQPAKVVLKQRVSKAKPQSMFWLHVSIFLLIILSILLIGWDLIVKFIL